MRFVGDLLLFVATSLVLSVTILCSIIQLQAHDERSRLFLPILIPLTLQLGIATLSSYLSLILPAETLASSLFESFSLFIAIASIILISMILYSVSVYIMRISRKYFVRRLRRIGTWVLVPLTLFFVIASLFGVLYTSGSDWTQVVTITLKYYSSWGALMLLPHVFSAAVLLSRISDREIQNHLRGIIYAFAPMPFFFVLDIIVFRNHYFKLSYISFAAFSVIVYWHRSKRFVREYLTLPQSARTDDLSFAQFYLSPREEETARLLIEGKSNAEIGKALYISENTVRSHIKSIYRKAEVGNRVQLIHKVRFGGSHE
jgi:DNA-binding CsgD family transcriptional regulator